LGALVLLLFFVAHLVCVFIVSFLFYFVQVSVNLAKLDVN